MIGRLSLHHVATGAALLAPGLAGAQRVSYEISFPDRVHHQAQVIAEFRDLPPGRPLELRMSRSSPGRYALHEFAKNVYAVRIEDGSGRELATTRPDPSGWTVAAPPGTVRVRYIVFGDRTDGTYAGIDASHAHLNMPAVFMWARGLEARPITVRFVPVVGWRVATQLAPTADSTVFTAPDLQYFMDSPTEVGPVELRTWDVSSPGGRRYTMRLALHHTGTAAQLDRYADKVKRVVEEEIAMWGEPAGFDFGSYTFLADYLPWADGDGMEHRNSTVLTSPGSLAEREMELLGTVAHEFFHSWNVERLRPRALEPFDFERTNTSGELWFAEGFTSYYDQLFIRRAGLSDDVRYGRALGSMVSSVVNAPGRRYFSPVEMSMQAPFVDAAVSIDRTNRGNTFLSYYTWGAGVGLALDLSIRQRFPGLSQDDFMRAMWRQLGRSQTVAHTPERPYTLDDLRRVLGEVTRDTAFANDFFRRYVHGREVVDYAALLANAGFQVRRANPDRPWMGVSLGDAAGGGAAATDYPLETGPAYEAGLTRGDVVVSAEGAPVADAAALLALAAGHRVGDRLRLEVRSRGTVRTIVLHLVEDPALEVVPFEAAGIPLSAEARAFRGAWLASRVER